MQIHTYKRKRTAHGGQKGADTGQDHFYQLSRYSYIIHIYNYFYYLCEKLPAQTSKTNKL